MAADLTLNADFQKLALIKATAAVKVNCPNSLLNCLYSIELA